MITFIRNTILLLLIHHAFLYTQDWIPQNINTTEHLFDISFSSSSVGWVVGSNGTVFKTTDKGFGWEKQSSPTTKSLFNISFSNNYSGVIVGESGTILRTSDGGISWTYTEIGSENLNSIFWINDSVAFVAGDNNQILRTIDTGINWMNIDYSSSISYSFKDIYFSDSLSGFIVGNGTLEGVALKSTDGGTTWFNTSVVPYLNKIVMLNNLTGYAVGINGSIIKTSDGGYNWLPLNSLGSDTLNSFFYKNAATFWVTGSNGFIAKTTDGGMNWTIQQTPTTNRINSIIFLDSLGLAIGDTGTLLYDYDSNIGFVLEEWVEIFDTTGIRMGEIHFVDESNGFCIVYENLLYKTTDSGINWTAFEMPDRILTMSFPDSLTGYVLCKNGYLMKTLDRGINWETISLYMDGNFGKLDFISNDIGFICLHYGSENKLYKTINGGIDLELIFNTTLKSIGDIEFINENRGWLITNDFNLFRTSDSGVTWKVDSLSQTLPIPENFLPSQLLFLDEHNGFLTVFGSSQYGDDVFMFRTTDSGENWELYIDHDYSKIEFVTKDLGWAIDLWSNLYYTTDSGFSWKSADFRINNVAFLKPDFGFSSRSYYDYNENTWISKVYRYGDLPQPSDSGTPPPLPPIEFQLSQNYPNPFNFATKINYSVPNKVFIEIKIYDILGRLVEKLVSEEKESGEYEIVWDSNQLSSGIYIYQLIGGNYSQTKKMVLLK